MVSTPAGARPSNALCAARLTERGRSPFSVTRACNVGTSDRVRDVPTARTAVAPSDGGPSRTGEARCAEIEARSRHRRTRLRRTMCRRYWQTPTGSTAPLRTELALGRVDRRPAGREGCAQLCVRRRLAGDLRFPTAHRPPPPTTIQGGLCISRDRKEDRENSSVGAVGRERVH